MATNKSVGAGSGSGSMPTMPTMPTMNAKGSSSASNSTANAKPLHQMSDGERQATMGRMGTDQNGTEYC